MSTPENETPPGWFKRWFGVLFRPSARFSVLALIVVGVVLGSGAVIGTQVAVQATGTNEFCVSCHEMNVNLTEYSDTNHFKNRSGVRAGCADCHIPHSYPEKLWVKSLAGAKDIYGHMLGVIDTPAKYEAKRYAMATSEQERLRKNGSAECKYCHNFEAMNPAKQKPFARAEHKRAQETGLSCIECHKGIAHNEPEAPRTTPAAPAGTAPADTTPAGTAPRAVEPAAAITTPAPTVAPAAPAAKPVDKPTAVKPAAAISSSAPTVAPVAPAAPAAKPADIPTAANPPAAAITPPIATAAPLPTEKFDQEAMLKLAKRSNCAGCHAMDGKKKGPSYRSTAAKYRGKPDASKMLVAKVMAGGEDKDHPEVEVNEADLAKLIQWILTQ